MHNFLLVDALTMAELLGCVVALAFIIQKKHLRTFAFVAAYLLTRLLSLCILLPVMYLSSTKHGQISVSAGYKIYFYTYWFSYAVEALLGFGIVYSLYKLAMDPLPGLQRLGMIMFRWAAGIGLALAASIACGPHITSISFLVKFVSELQRSQSVLTLCLLLFVTLASKPMGLSFRSKIVGVSLGLGVLSATDLVQSGWIGHTASMHSLYDVINGFAICVTLSIWMTYMAMPEPRRRMIVLPTTSPFLRWNQISQVLGDEPGFVAIGRVTPEMFAPAEVEIMLRASAKIHSQRMTATG